MTSWSYRFWNTKLLYEGAAFVVKHGTLKNNNKNAESDASTKLNESYEVVTQPMHFQDVTSVLHQAVQPRASRQGSDTIYKKVAACILYAPSEVRSFEQLYWCVFENLNYYWNACLHCYLTKLTDTSPVNWNCLLWWIALCAT